MRGLQASGCPAWLVDLSAVSVGLGIGPFLLAGEPNRRMLTAATMLACLTRNRRSLSAMRLCARLSTTSKDGSKATLPA